MVIVMIVMGFLMTFIVTNFTLCLGFQCSQNTSTTYSTSVYLALKQAFISCELACSIIYLVLSILYIIFFVKCYQQIPRIHPMIRPLPPQSALGKRQLSTLSRTSRPCSTLSSLKTIEQTRILSSSSLAQKVCPNCKHVSPYTSQESIIQCPNCKYQSSLVEHAQQW